MSTDVGTRPAGHDDVALVDLVDRLIDKGVVLAGDLTLSVADVDLVHVSLRLLVSAADRGTRPDPEAPT